MKYLYVILALLLIGCSAQKAIKTSYLIDCSTTVPDNYVTSAWLEDKQVGAVEAVDPSCILNLTDM